MQGADDEYRFGLIETGYIGRRNGVAIQQQNHKIEAFIFAFDGQNSKGTLAHVSDGARAVTTVRAAYEAARTGKHVAIDRWW